VLGKTFGETKIEGTKELGTPAWQKWPSRWRASGHRHCHCPYQSSAKSLGIDAGDGQRDDVNTRCLQDISKIESPRIEY